MEVWYPAHPLAPPETVRSHTGDAKVKAHYLISALPRLLEIVGAPPVVAADLRILLSGYLLKEETGYSKVQRRLLQLPRKSYRKIAEGTGVDQSEISQSVAAGHLIDPWREGRQ